MGRKPSNQSAIQPIEGIQNGGIVWVLYRKKSWPVKVKRVYMKTKKITYNFLPVKNHPNVFSVEMKNVKAFNAIDKLPPDVSKEQKDAYEIALKMLNGEYTDDEDNNQSDFDDEDDVKYEVDNEIKDTISLSKRKTKNSKQEAPLTIKLKLKKSTKSAADSLNSKSDLNDINEPKKLINKTKIGTKRSIDSAEFVEKDNLEKIKFTIKKEEGVESSSRNSDDDKPLMIETKENSKTKLLIKKNQLKIKSETAKNFFDTEIDNNNEILNKNIDTKKVTTKKHIFKCGDVVAVHTEVGMWPAIIIKKLNENEVTNKIFPIENSPEESKIDTQHFVPFPVDNLDKMIEDSKDKPSLNKALQSVKHYLQNQNNNNNFVNEMDHKEIVKIKSKREERANAKLLKEQKEKAKNNDEILNEKHSKKLLEKNDLEKKKLKLDIDNNLKSNNNSAKISTINSETNSNEKLSIEKQCTNATSNNLKKIENNEKFKVRKRERSNSVINDNLLNKRQREKSSSIENQLLTETNKKNENETENTKTKLPFFFILLSDKVKNYLNSIWSNKVVSKRHNEYIKPKTILDLQFNFNCGDLLTLDELNKALIEFHGWIALCTRIPPMSQIFEYHYIANVVLPETCIYALSEFDNISYAEAETKFLCLIEQQQNSYKQSIKCDNNSSLTEKKYFNENNSEEKISNGSHNTSLNQQERTAAFQDLLLAATIMQDKEKNQNCTD